MPHVHCSPAGRLAYDPDTGWSRTYPPAAAAAGSFPNIEKPPGGVNRVGGRGGDGGDDSDMFRGRCGEFDDAAAAVGDPVEPFCRLRGCNDDGSGKTMSDEYPTVS